MQKDGDKDSEVRAYNAAAAKHNYLNNNNNIAFCPKQVGVG
jgi:hypothetical protein